VKSTLAVARCLLLGAGLLGLAFSSVVQAASGDDRGKQLFTKDATPPCAVCHTLSDAGATGAVGPSLDDLKPDEPRVIRALKSGVGVMPAYTQLSADDMQAIARYVARTTGAAK
jgi:mono/diheme cytochrome c family protein